VSVEFQLIISYSAKFCQKNQTDLFNQESFPARKRKLFKLFQASRCPAAKIFYDEFERYSLLTIDLFLLNIIKFLSFIDKSVEKDI